MDDNTLVIFTSDNGQAGVATKPKTAPPWLYNLNEDVGETKNVAEESPEVVASIAKLAREFDRTLSEEMRPAYGSNVRKQPRKNSK